MSSLSSVKLALRAAVVVVSDTPWQDAATIDTVVAACQVVDVPTRARLLVSWARTPTADDELVARSRLVISAVNQGRVDLGDTEIGRTALMLLSYVAYVTATDAQGVYARMGDTDDAGQEAAEFALHRPLLAELSAALVLYLAEVPPAPLSPAASADPTSVFADRLGIYVSESDLKYRPRLLR